MIFPYRQHQLGTQLRLVPLVPLTVHHRSHLRVRALVDSGADHTVFSLELAERLAIPYWEHRRVQIQGIIGAPVPAYQVGLHLTLGPHRWFTDVLFADHLAAGAGLLGQRGFFEFFNVTFRYRRREIDIRRAR